MREFIKKSIAGIFFGAFISILIVYGIIFTGDFGELHGEAFVKYSLVSMLLGALTGISIWFFETFRLSLLQKTIIHFIIFVPILYGIVSLTGWVQIQSITGFIVLGLILIATYVAVWFGFYLYFRHIASRLNDELKQL